MGLFSHSLKKKKVDSTKMYNIIPDTTDGLYDQGENFIKRCLHHKQNNNETTTKDGLNPSIHHGNMQQVNTTNNNNITIKDYGDKPMIVRPHLHHVEKADKSTIIQKEISLFYWHHFQKHKNTFTVAMDTVKRRGRRNAVCEQNEEERVGLRLCVQRYRHLVYMIEYEI